MKSFELMIEANSSNENIKLIIFDIFQKKKKKA